MESLRLSFALLHPVAAIALVLWLPLHLVTNGLIGDDTAVMGLSNLAEVFAGALVTSSILSALATYREGRSPGFRESLASGFQSWGSLVLTNILAGVVILLGFVVLILPGIYFLLTYALIAPIVVLEGTSGRAALTLSGQLTEGRKWSIAVAAFPLFALVLTLGVAYAALEIASETMALPHLIWVVTTSLIDLAGNVMSVPITILMALFFWEAEGEIQDDGLHIFTPSSGEP